MTYEKIRQIRKQLGNILDEAEEILAGDTTPRVKRQADYIRGAIYPIHEGLYQVEKKLET